MVDAYRVQIGYIDKETAQKVIENLNHNGLNVVSSFYFSSGMPLIYQVNRDDDGVKYVRGLEVFVETNERPQPNQIREIIDLSTYLEISISTKGEKIQ